MVDSCTMAGQTLCQACCRTFHLWDHRGDPLKHHFYFCPYPKPKPKCMSVSLKHFSRGQENSCLFVCFFLSSHQAAFLILQWFCISLVNMPAGGELGNAGVHQAWVLPALGSLGSNPDFQKNMSCPVINPSKRSSWGSVKVL